MKGSHKAKEHMNKEDINFIDKQTEKFEQVFGDAANKMLAQGMTPKDAMNMSQSYLENVYAQAYRFYNTGKYSEAAHLFRLLIMFNAMEPKYMLGLAACYHMLKDYSNAIQTYTMCSALDPHNPIPQYHSSDCFIQTKEYLSAMISLELAIDRAGDKPEYTKMKERAQLSLESLKKLVTSNPIEETPSTEEK